MKWLSKLTYNASPQRTTLTEPHSSIPVSVLLNGKVERCSPRALELVNNNNKKKHLRIVGVEAEALQPPLLGLLCPEAFCVLQGDDAWYATNLRRRRRDYRCRSCYRYLHHHRHPAALWPTWCNNKHETPPLHGQCRNYVTTCMHNRIWSSLRGVVHQSNETHCNVKFFPCTRSGRSSAPHESSLSESSLESLRLRLTTSSAGFGKSVPQRVCAMPHPASESTTIRLFS